MSEEEEEARTFNEEQRAIFEQPDDAPVKTRPRTPGERNVPQPNLDDVGIDGAGESRSKS
ncbi:MAG: hypothetical protein QOF61_1730 [Acidobacteriota bacterium]|jgi:hypothetical protein|nr:hypothetical protein [Acidobacteriota bacterium]